MSKLSKILVVLMIAVMLVAVAQPMVFATSSAESIAEGIKGDVSTVDSTKLQSVASKVLSVIQVATVILAVILVAVFGFKFVLGSAQEKADYQKSFIPLIVGVVVVFAASSIAKLIMILIFQSQILLFLKKVLN